MNDIKLIVLISGKKKNGSGKWYRATLKGHNSEGKPVVESFFLSEEVGDKAVKDGLTEDCPVNVTLGFDDYMRPSIVALTKSPSTGKGGSSL